MKRTFSFIISALILLTASSCGRKNSNANEIAVFYFTYSDTYISGVRAALDGMLQDADIPFTDYDAAGSQTTQTEQVQTAVAKGATALAVNIVDTGSDDAAQNIVNMAKEKNIPVIFFNRSVNEDIIASYDKCIFVGTDFEMAGHMQGQMIGEYIIDNYDAVDRNGDGKISYVLFKGQEGNMEAISRTKYSVEDANKLLVEAGKPALSFYDASNTGGYLVDQDGLWSSVAATNYMSTILAKHSDAAGNMVELVIANNDEMALGAISALQGAGYNTDGKAGTIPVFGVDATPAAREAISAGTMVGSVKQDAQGMAEAIITAANNFAQGKAPLDGIDPENTVGDRRINIPYSSYTGD